MSTPVSNARRWTIVGLLFTASLINYFDRATVSFALPLISEEFKLGPIEKGRLLSAFFWSYALMQIPLGWCADRMNLRWLYAGAFALWSLAQGLTGLATGVAMLMGFRVLLGIGEAIYLPGGSKIVSLLFSRTERGLPAGIFDFGTRTGLVIEGLLVPWMLTHWGWRKTFVVVGFTALLWLVPWMLALPKRISLKSTRKENERGTWPEFFTVFTFSGLLLLSLLAFLSLDKVSNGWIAVAIALGLGVLLVFAIWFASLKMLASSRSGSAAVLLRALTACRNQNLIGICQ
jgi:MFS family permease